MNEKTFEDSFDKDERPQTVSEYEGTVSSPALSGEAKLLICADGLVIDGLFNRESVAYADMDSIAFEDYAVQIKANGETICISQMGRSCEWFHHELLDAYNSKVLSSFYVTGAPDLETEGQYRREGINSNAVIRVFSDCLCILPPDLKARRIPFVFLNGMKKEDYTLTVMLNTGEAYSFSMLGSDLDPLENVIADHVRTQRNNDTAFIKKLRPAAGFSESAKAGVLLREGIAVPLKKLPAMLAEILEAKVRNSKMCATYEQLKNICDHEHLAVGIKSLPEEDFEALKQALVEKLNENAEESAEESAELTFEQEDALRWVIWAVILSKDGKTAVAEFSFPGEDAATYLFRADLEWERFLILLNWGMEATKMRREVFSLTEEALKKEEYAQQRMLIVRTPALEELRKRFIGRVIHRSDEGWKKSLVEKLREGCL